jgi:putative phosphoesterase
MKVAAGGPVRYHRDMPPRLVVDRARVPVDGGSGRIAVVADTHSRPHPEAAAHLAALEPDAILHAGDIGDLSVLDDLRHIAPVFAVRGNIDTRAPDLPDVLHIDLERGGKALRILLIHIAVYGPKIRADVARMARAESAALVVCGHSHVPFIGQDRGLTVFNPGSIGPRRFSLPIVFGTIDLAPGGVRLAHVDCETGRPWLPS